MRKGNRLIVNVVIVGGWLGYQIFFLELREMEGGRRISVSPRPCSGRRVVAKKRARGSGVDGFVNSVKKLQRREISSKRDRAFSMSDAQERFRNIRLQVGTSSLLLLFFFPLYLFIYLFLCYLLFNFISTNSSSNFKPTSFIHRSSLHNLYLFLIWFIHSCVGGIWYPWSKRSLFHGTAFSKKEVKDNWDCSSTWHCVCSCSFWCLCSI